MLTRERERIVARLLTLRRRTRMIGETLGALVDQLPTVVRDDGVMVLSEIEAAAGAYHGAVDDLGIAIGDVIDAVAML